MFDYLFEANPGPEARKRILDETFKFYQDNLNPGFLKYKRSVKHDAQGVEWRGEGVYMYDLSGQRFIDCLGGYGVFALGHRHPHVVKRVEQCLERIGLYSQELLNPLQAVLAHEIATRAPGDLQYVYYHCGGGESNDAALKMARLATGRHQHVSFTGAFHGKTFGALSATNRPAIKAPFEPLVYGFRLAPYNDVDAIDSLVTEQVASVIVEAIQGEGGIFPATREFLHALRARCTEVGALLHVDEVQSGWGRTGHYFCSEIYGLEPDIVTLGKALGGGVTAQSAFVANARAFFGHREHDPHFRGLEGNPWYLSNTFAGAQTACAAGLATIEVYEGEGLLEKCREKGAYLKAEIAALVERHPDLLKEVRGTGLWLGLECRAAPLGTALADELFKRDVLVAQTINNPRTLRFQPPLIITREQLDSVLSALEASLKALAAAPVAA
jgi:putrescine aminotransferase